MSSTITIILASVGAALAVLILTERLFRLITRMRVDTMRARVEIDQLRRELEDSRSRQTTGSLPPSSRAPSRLIDASPHQQIPPPEPSDELSAEVASGRCVLFVGSGIASQAGYPTFPELLDLVIEKIAPSQPDEPWPSVREQLSVGATDSVVDFLRARVGREYLSDLLRAEVRAIKPRSSALEVLAAIPFVGAITVDWTGLALHALRVPSTLAITPGRSAGAADALRERRHFVLEASGDIDSGPLLLTAEDMREAALANREYSRFIVSLLTTRSLLFLGTSIRGLEQFLGSVDLRTSSSRRHTALVPWEPSFTLESERLMTRYGVGLVPYPSEAGHEATLTRFAHQLCDKTSPSGIPRLPPISEATQLEEVTLLNIGPFTKLSVALDGHTILLGDNGSGKSTILRAIALALAGDAATPAMAERMLKTSADQGEVSLRTAHDTYRTRLVRDGPAVRIESDGLSPIQTSAWLALGFPPLRGVSTTNPAGPTRAAGGSPTPEDLLPLLSDGPDQRLDGLKQWVVNAATRADSSARPSARDAELLERFFDVLGDITPGLDFQYRGVDPETWAVLLDSPDGQLSFDLLSRGMTAVMGWIGILLQRLYEVYGDREGRPEEHRALVLGRRD